MMELLFVVVLGTASAKPLWTIRPNIEDACAEADLQHGEVFKVELSKTPTVERGTCTKVPAVEKHYEFRKVEGQKAPETWGSLHMSSGTLPWTQNLQINTTVGIYVP